MDFRDVLLILHIAAVGTWLGANVVQAVVSPLVSRTGPETQAWWYRQTGALSSRLYMPAGILVLLTGVLLVLQNDAYGFGTPFVTIGLSVVVLGAVFGIVVFGPGGDEAATAAEGGDETALRRVVAKIARFGVIDTLLLLVAITAMVLRLGA